MFCSFPPYTTVLTDIKELGKGALHFHSLYSILRMLINDRNNLPHSSELIINWNANSDNSHKETDSWHFSDKNGPRRHDT